MNRCIRVCEAWTMLEPTVRKRNGPPRLFMLTLEVKVGFHSTTDPRKVYHEACFVAGDYLQVTAEVPRIDHHGLRLSAANSPTAPIQLLTALGPSGHPPGNDLN